MEHYVAHNAPAESDAEDDLLARNIWLAGLGVYSMSLQEAQSLDGKAESMFEKLVDLGRFVSRASVACAVREPPIGLALRLRQQVAELCLLPGLLEPLGRPGLPAPLPCPKGPMALGVSGFSLSSLPGTSNTVSRLE